MRPRIDFYTLCPKCEAKVPLTLASKLQAGRAGCSCACGACKNEWICIQEWIYRSQLAPLPIAMPPASPVISQPFPQPVVHGPQSVPRPHLPLGGPVMAPQYAASGSSLPQPHAWNWERQSAPRQPVTTTAPHGNSGYSSFSR